MLSITRIVWISLFFTGVAHAQVQEEIRRCASIGSDAERLACYDRLFRDSSAAASRTTASAPPPVATSAPAPAPAAAAATAAATAAGSTAATASDGEFGANPRLQEEQRRRETKAAGDVQELRARIKRVEPHPYGLHVLTLENGQVWQQKEKVWELELKPGDEVVIRRGMLGSYRLQLGGEGVSAAVTRVK